MTKEQFFALLDRYLAGKTTSEEEKALFDVYEQMESKSGFDVGQHPDVHQLEADLIRRFKQTTADVKEPVYIRLKHKLQPFYIAASILVLISIATWLYLTNHTSTNGAILFQEGYTDNLVTVQNLDNKPLTVAFPDHSTVVLNSGSRIRYPKTFAGPQRKVYLEGTGFFEVAQQADKPFIVFTDHLVTKVLGTSFTVSSDGKTPASVTVVTGKVAVFKAESFKVKNEGLLLTPNHTASLTTQNVIVEKLADQPQLVVSPKDIQFDFESTPISEVFKRLEDAYNINIEYDHEKLKHCSLTVNMANEDFFTRLTLICNTLDLTYKNVNGKIIITGEGCESNL